MTRANARRWGRVSVAVAILLLASRAAASDDGEAAVAALTGIVDSVVSAGRWQSGDGAGFFRVVVLRGGYEHVVNRLYLQWLRDGDSESRHASSARSA